MLSTSLQVYASSHEDLEMRSVRLPLVVETNPCLNAYHGGSLESLHEHLYGVAIDNMCNVGRVVLAQ